MYNSQYYTCEQIDQRLLQGYLDDYNYQNGTNLTKEQFLTLLYTILNHGLTIDDIVQGLGDNPNKVISQKVVSEELDKIGTTIDNTIIKIIGIFKSSDLYSDWKIGDIMVKVVGGDITLRRCIAQTSGVATEFEIIPFSKDAVYSYNGAIWIYDGTNLVPTTDVVVKSITDGNSLSLGDFYWSKTYKVLRVIIDNGGSPYSLSGDNLTIIYNQRKYLISNSNLIPQTKGLEDDVLIPNSENLTKGKAVVDLLINKEKPSAFASVNIIPNSSIDDYGNLKANDNKVCTNLIKTPCSITVNDDYFIHNGVLYRLDTNGNIVFDHIVQNGRSVKTDTTTATNYYAVRYVFGKITDEAFTTETANDIISNFTPAYNGVIEDINAVKSDITTLKRNKTIRLKSWENSSEISAIGEYYWSTSNKLLRLCVADNFSSSNSYISVPLQPDCLYFYKDRLYKANDALNDLIEFNLTSYFGYMSDVGLEKSPVVVGWLDSNNVFSNRNTCKCIVIELLDTNIKIVTKSLSATSYYGFADSYPTNGTPVQRVQVTPNSVLDITAPSSAKYFILTVNNEGVKTYPEFLLINGLSIPRDTFDSWVAVLTDILTPMIVPVVLNDIGYSDEDITVSTAQNNKFIVYSAEDTPVISDDNRYVISSPIAVTRGDYIKFTCSVNVSLNVSVITQCDSEGTPIKSLARGVATNNYTYGLFIEEDGYICVCYNKIYQHSTVDKLSFETIHLLYDLIQTKQATVQLKTINGQSLIGVGDLTIAQGPQGIQGPAGPAGPQGNSGYQGAAGELQVVNNLTDGGATAALSAEQGKILGDRTTFNSIPITPCFRHGTVYGDNQITPDSFNAIQSNSIDSEIKKHFDLVTKSIRDAVKLKLPAGTTSNRIYRTFDEAFDASELFLNFGVHIDDDNAEKYTSIAVWMNSGSDGLDANSYCSYTINTYQDASHSRTGAFYNCLHLYAIGTKGANFNLEQVKHIGITINYTNEITDKYAYVTDLNFVHKMKKPGVCIIVDNFAPAVVNMADYAYSKGVPLNLSIIPNWIGDSRSATLEQIRAAQRQGHFIWNHTWNHVITQQTELQISEELFKSDDWLMEKGFARGAKVYSNPSSYYDNIRYKAQFNSNAQAIYHHWTKYPYGEISQNPIYLLFNPVYPSTRMMLNISGLDWNNPTDANCAYFINLAQAALTYGGLAVIGFHGTFWGGNTDSETLAGDRWKRFIDAVAAQEGQYFYTIDELLEGRFD